MLKGNTYSIDQVLSLTEKRKPDFDNILRILNREVPSRPTLFEFVLNHDLHYKLTGITKEQAGYSPTEDALWAMEAFRRGGYDYFTLYPSWDVHFPMKDHASEASISQNDGVMIYDQTSFDAYPWPDPTSADYSHFEVLNERMIPGMKTIPCSPGGVLENTINLLGFDNMCFLIYDNPQLLENTFNKVGEVLLAYYKMIVDYECVGALMVNDDWGFNTQTVLPLELMRQYVVPWHKRIVEVIHGSGKKAILHSCGQLKDIMNDVIDVIGYDGKHSYEDKITPVEEAFDLWGNRIGIFGGLDMNFVCTKSPLEVYQRAKGLLVKTGRIGGYALGTGNSVPEYVPTENYVALLLAALERM